LQNSNLINPNTANARELNHTISDPDWAKNKINSQGNSYERGYLNQNGNSYERNINHSNERSEISPD